MDTHALLKEAGGLIRAVNRTEREAFGTLISTALTALEDQMAEMMEMLRGMQA